MDKNHLPMQETRFSTPGPGRFHLLQTNKAHGPQLQSLSSRAHELELLSPLSATAAATAEAPVPRAYGTREATLMRITYAAMEE